MPAALAGFFSVQTARRAGERAERKVDYKAALEILKNEMAKQEHIVTNGTAESYI